MTFAMGGILHAGSQQSSLCYMVDSQAGPGGPLSPEALLIRTLPHDLVMGRMAQGFPQVLHDLVMGGISRAGSWQS